MVKDGNRLNTTKCDFFEKKIDQVGHEREQQGILQDKLEAITEIKIANNGKELEFSSVSGGITILVKMNRKFVNKHE